MTETNLYEGNADGRQGDSEVKTSRFRPRYRALSEEEKALHDEIKSKAEELEKLYDKIQTATFSSRYCSLAITSLEQSVMWAIKELTK